NRREQNSVAMMTGGVDESVDRPGAEDRRIVAAARPMADPHLIDRQFLDRGHRPPSRFEQGEHAARGQRGVRSLFLSTRAPPPPTILASMHGTKTSAGAQTTWVKSGAAGSIRSASICPLIGRTGGSSSGPKPAMLRDHAPAASTTTSAATLVPSARTMPSTRP